MEYHRQQYLGEKIALIRIDGISGRKIRSWRNVDVIGLFKYPSEFFCPPWMPIRLCVLSKRIYSSRVKLGVPCNILNTLIDISQSADFYLPRVIYFCLYVSSFYSSSFLPRYFPLPPLPPIIDDRPLLDIGGFVLTTLLTSRFVFSITSDPKEFARILNVNSKSSR